MRMPVSHFTILRLRNDDPASWAVISVPDGAIATGEDGRLVMRLTKSGAEQIASVMTASKLASDGGAQPED